MSDSLDLHELNAKSAGIGAWELKVHKMRFIEYDYTWQNQPKKGHKFECRLVAADCVYCQGVIKAETEVSEDNNEDINRKEQETVSTNIALDCETHEIDTQMNISEKQVLPTEYNTVDQPWIFLD